MHIVTTSNSVIAFIPRSMPTSVNVVITDEETKVETTVENRPTSVVGNSLVIAITTGNYQFKEGRFYNFRAYAPSGKEVYRGRAFCTDQSNLEKFTINEGVYSFPEEQSTSNEYIYR